MTRPMDNLKVRIAPGADLTADRSTWTWVDITPRVHSPVTITHGRASESAQAGPDIFEATVENDDGALSPDNPLGPWYPDLDEGTPLQVYWDTTENIRFEGNITDLPIQWRVPTVTAMSPIQASGPLERLQQGAQALDSPLFRALSTEPLVVAYWPCEDGKDSTRAASPIAGVSPMPINSEMSAVDGPPGSDRLVRAVVGESSTTARVPNHTPGDVYVIELAWRMDEDLPAGRAMMNVFTTSPDLAQWRISASGTTFRLLGFDDDHNTVVDETETISPDLVGQWVRVELRLHDSGGGNVSWDAHLFGIDTEQTVINGLSGTDSGDLGRVVRVGVGAGGIWVQERFFGQIAVLTGTAVELPDFDEQLTFRTASRHAPYHGFTGELAADRFERLCEEENLTCSIVAPVGALNVPSGSNASTPDAAALDIVGDIDVRGWVAPRVWEPGVAYIAKKWNTAGDERSWRLGIDSASFATGTGIRLNWTTDGTSGTTQTVTGALAPVPPDGLGGFAAIRATLDVDDGAGNHVVTFYHGPSLDGPWTEFYTETIAGTTSIHSGTADVTVGHDDNVNAGRDMVIREFRLYDGIDGTLVASPDFTAQEIGATSFDDAQGNTWTINGDAAIVRANDSMPMGPQQIDTLVRNLQDVPATDGGRLTEHMGGFRYRTRTTLYDQDDALTVMPQPHMPVAPRPTRDNQRIRNDITATIPGGTSERATDETSIGKRGRLEDAITVNPETVDQLAQIAYWRLHIGTVKGMRWPRLPLRLSPSNPDLIADWLAVRVGDRIAVDHQFTQIPGVDIDLLVEGWTESWDAIQWDVSLNCVPAQPYTVPVFDTARFDTAGSELDENITDSATSFDVASDGQPWVNSTDHASEFPLDVTLGGEVMTVTAISGDTSPQTFTVTRSVNGVVKSHSDGDPVRLSTRPVFAL